jgi:hypothetical protein
LVPGFHSGFPERSGFCFRVNLARDSEAFRDALSNLYSFLRSKTDVRQRRKSKPAMAQVANGFSGSMP